MIHCNDPHFTYIGLPRTGSVAMHKWLLQKFRCTQLSPRHRIELPPNPGLVWTVVRNPFEVQLSHYLYRHTTPANNMHRHVKDWSFRRYLEWQLDASNTPSHAREPCQSGALLLGGVDPDVILHLEWRPEDLASQLPFADSETFWGMPRHNANAPYKLADFYDDETEAMVVALNGGDFIVFGYDPDQLPE